MQLRFFIFFGLSFYFSLAQEQVSFYFQSDKFELEQEQVSLLNKWIENNTDSKIISIIGEADANGTTTYNEVLSVKRVDYIVQKINNKIQVRADFKTVGLGESKISSSIDAENRKVTIYFLSKTKLHLEEFIINDLTVLKKLDSITIVSVEKLNFSPKLAIEAVIKKAPVGTLFTLEEIQFQFDSAELMKSAKIELDNWLTVLNENPQMKIVIQGHICCIPKDEILLSSQRAKSVMKYFISRGISEDRMHYIGFGSSRPKYKIPEKNGYEALMNRRVEIVILEK